MKPRFGSGRGFESITALGWIPVPAPSFSMPSIVEGSMNQIQKIQIMIFDCDGVLFDSRQANVNFYNHIRDHFGLPPMAEEEVDFVHMHTADESVRYIFRGTPHTEAAQTYRKALDYTPFLKDMIMEPGLRRLLDFCKPRCRLAVVTNRSNTIDSVLKKYGLSSYFDMVVSSLDVRYPKPHPESLLKVLDRFQVAPGHAQYIGDSLVDARAAEGAGIPFIAYRNPGLDAQVHVNSMGEIEEMMRNGE
jgi:HAD superfamily hydrolase (TIGR01509 family)